MLPLQRHTPDSPTLAGPTGDDRHEAQRLAALDRLDVLDSAREPAFDRLARLVRLVFGVEIALVSLIDAHRQWFKACDGLQAEEARRDQTFCRHTIRQPEPLVVEDARDDPRFAGNPHVVGPPFVRFYAGVPLTTPDGHNVGTVCAIDPRPRRFDARDAAILGEIAGMAMDLMELRNQAARDALTGLLTRRAFTEVAGRAVGLAQRHRTNFSAVLFDLDHFKRINDGHGHAAGDAVLVAVAKACEAALRDTDWLARIGGEEFAVALPQTDRRGALAAAEKLRAAIAAQLVHSGGAELRVTASFGVATLDLATTSLEALLAHADAALYAAKGAGRNRVEAWRADSAVAQTRRRVLKAGFIHFNNRMSTVDCTVRSLGEDGAGLDLSSTQGLPDRFNLAVRADGTDRPARVVARTDRHLEVEFI